MRHFLPTLLNGILDYIIGILLIVSPWLFGFSHLSTAAVCTPIVFGAIFIVYSLLTRYEVGILPLIPMPVHRFMDIFFGVLLALSPVAFGFGRHILWPHLTGGLIQLALGVLTRPITTVASATAIPDTGGQ